MSTPACDGCGRDRYILSQKEVDALLRSIPPMGEERDAECAPGDVSDSLIQPSPLPPVTSSSSAGVNKGNVCLNCGGEAVFYRSALGKHQHADAGKIGGATDCDAACTRPELVKVTGCFRCLFRYTGTLQDYCIDKRQHSGLDITEYTSKDGLFPQECLFLTDGKPGPGVKIVAVTGEAQQNQESDG